MIRSDYVELRWVFSVIRRRLWLILGFPLLVATSTFLIISQIPPVYRASTTLLVQQASDTSFSDYNALRAGEQLASTYSKMVGSWQVMETVINRLDLDETPGSLEKRVSAEGIKGTQLLILHVEDTNPSLAALIADTIAEVFIEQIQTQQEQRFAGLISGIQEQMDETLALIGETQAQINALNTEESCQDTQESTCPDASSKSYLEANLAVYSNTYAMLYNSYEQMRLTMIRVMPQVIVVEKALTPGTPIKPQKKLFTSLAMLVSLMMAIGLVFLWEHLDESTKNALRRYPGKYGTAETGT